MKGVRVRHTQLVDSEGYYWYGTITYYDRLHDLVYVLWDATADCKFLLAAPFPKKYLKKVNEPLNWQHDPRRR